MPEENDDLHIIEAIGRSRITVRNGKVTEVSVSRLRRCPLARKFARPVDEISPDAVKENIENRIDEWGMCRPDRSVSASGEFVGFGASELISSGLLSGMFDAAVIACEGAGTVVVTTPAMVQGIGGRMSGLVSTSPIPPVMDRIQKGGGIVLDRAGAMMNPAAGVRLAYDKGFSRVAVTVATADIAQSLRVAHPEVFIFGVHTSGLSREDADAMISAVDIVTACASKWIWQLAGPKALLQAGSAVPVFALTKRGKKLILDKIARDDRPVLVSGSKLPVYGPEIPDPLI